MQTLAQAVKDACLKALKERLIDRAHIIETRLEEEQAALTKRQLGYQRQVCLYEQSENRLYYTLKNNVPSYEQIP